MGTFYAVTYRGGIAAHQLKPALEDSLAAMEKQLSNWDDDSWISRFNRRTATRFVPIPEHAYQVLRRCLDLTRHTNGALDPTLGPLINLWGFGPAERSSPPTDRAIRKALAATGRGKLTIENAPPRVAKGHPALRLNLSSVAKGYAADVLAGHLASRGLTDYMINIGGEIRTRGRSAHQSTWAIAIQRPDPEARSGSVHVTVRLNAAGVATSGDYRRYFEVDGERYPHILDPKTGRPARSDVASATVIAATATRADGLATAALVLGSEKAQELIARTPDAEILLIQRVKPDRFRTVTSTGWPDSTATGTALRDPSENRPAHNHHTPRSYAF